MYWRLDLLRLLIGVFALVALSVPVLVLSVKEGLDLRKRAEKKGLLSRFKFWGNSNSDKQKKEQYRVLVKDEGERAEVNVLNKEGGKEQSATANRILTLLYDQLK